jgi:hypothetical protein
MTTNYIGVNIAVTDDYSPQQLLKDRFKESQAWTTGSDLAWSTGEETLLKLNNDNYPISIKNVFPGQKFTHIKTSMNDNLDGEYPGGKYLCLYDGTTSYRTTKETITDIDGTTKEVITTTWDDLHFDFDAKIDPINSKPGRIVLNVVPNSGIILKLTDINEQDPIRNIRIIQAEYEQDYLTQPFNPLFLKFIKDAGFKGIRMMDALRTNNSGLSINPDKTITAISKTWENRSKLSFARFDTVYELPIELVVQLGNIANGDIWYNISTTATDDYITQAAKYLHDNLKPGIKVYVEYSNETWNYGALRQGHWILQQACVDFAEKLAKPDSNKWYLAIDWYSRRCCQIGSIFTKIYTDRPEDIFPVVAGQSGNLEILNQILKCEWSPTPVKVQDFGVKGMAIAPYIDLAINDSNLSSVLNWTLDDVFEEINVGGKLPGGYKGGTLQGSFDQIIAHVDLAVKHSLDLVAYEGGQSLVCYANNPKITELFTAANRDSRMSEIYTKYLNKWFELGKVNVNDKAIQVTKAFFHYSSIGRYDASGAWGIIEKYGKITPKLQAVQNFINGTSSSQVSVIDIQSTSVVEQPAATNNVVTVSQLSFVNNTQTVLPSQIQITGVNNNPQPSHQSYFTNWVFTPGINLQDPNAADLILKNHPKFYQTVVQYYAANSVPLTTPLTTLAYTVYPTEVSIPVEVNNLTGSIKSIKIKVKGFNTQNGYATYLTLVSPENKVCVLLFGVYPGVSDRLPADFVFDATVSKTEVIGDNPRSINLAPVSFQDSIIEDKRLYPVAKNGVLFGVVGNSLNGELSYNRSFKTDLNVFNGDNPNGTWRIVLTNTNALTTSSLDSVELDIATV